MSASDRYPFIAGVLRGRCEHIAEELRMIEEILGGPHDIERVRGKLRQMAEYAETAKATADKWADEAGYL